MASVSKSLYKGSDEIYNQDCDVCLSNGKTSEAISYCNICCELLCQSCDMAHRGSRASRDHTILTGSNIPSVSTRKQPTLSFLFCDTHRTSVLDTYCSTHDEVMCPACKMTNHATCKTNTVSTKHSANNDAEKELKKVANRLRDMTIRYDNLTKNRTTDKSTVISQIQNCLRDMQDFHKDLNATLDKLEKKMSSEILQIEETMKKEIDGHVTLADDILHQIGDLEESLSECEKTLEDDVIFVGAKKAYSRVSEYGHIIGKIEKEIHQIDIRFQPNGVLSDMIQQLQSLGTIVNNRLIHSGSKKTSILNMSVKERQAIGVTLDTVWGCTFMSDGHLVLACGKDGLKLFDENFLLETLLPVTSFDVTTINDTDVIVTQGGRKQLKRIRIFPGMVAKKALKMDRKCYGVDVYGDEIYVTCHDGPGNGEVRVLNMDGNVQRRLGVVKGKYIFTLPDYVKINWDGSKVFVSDADTNTVTCLNNHGHVIYRYLDRDLETPRGMYVDGKDNLLVCGMHSRNVHMIRDDGKQEKIFLSEKDGIHKPVCISFRPSDGCLVVSLRKNPSTDPKLITFSTR